MIFFKDSVFHSMFNAISANPKNVTISNCQVWWKITCLHNLLWKTKVLGLPFSGYQLVQLYWRLPQGQIWWSCTYRRLQASSLLSTRKLKKKKVLVVWEEIRTHNLLITRCAHLPLQVCVSRSACLFIKNLGSFKIVFNGCHCYSFASSFLTHDLISDKWSFNLSERRRLHCKRKSNQWLVAANPMKAKKRLSTKKWPFFFILHWIKAQY